MGPYPAWDDTSGWDDEPPQPAAPATRAATTAAGTAASEPAKQPALRRLRGGGGRRARLGPGRLRHRRMLRRMLDRRAGTPWVGAEAAATAPWPSPSRWRGRAAFALAGIAALAAAMVVVARTPVTRTFRPTHLTHPALGRPAKRSAAPGRPARAVAASPGRGYAFRVPAGWRDQTRQLAASYGSVRPIEVLTGRAAGGFVADLSVVRQPVAAPPSLRQLAASLPTRLPGAFGATPAGSLRGLWLGGAPAVAADWTLRSGGHPLRVRQVASYHQGAVWLLTFTAAADAFPTDVGALDQAIATWRWTS